MNEETPPGIGGASEIPGRNDRSPSTIRTKIKASPGMAARLQALLWRMVEAGMNAVTTIEAANDILTFLPGCHGEEFEQRVKLRGFRNAASALIASTESANARSLAWLIVEIATDWLYANVDIDTLREINRHANRLLITAVQAQTLHDEGIAA